MSTNTINDSSMPHSKTGGIENDKTGNTTNNLEELAMALPLSKIKKIFKMDPEYSGSSASAVYVTGVATELFVQYLVEQASMNAKAEKRKKIQYRDLSSAVSSQESLYFLSDTIPRTQTVEKTLKEKKINVSDEDRAKHSALLGENDASVELDPQMLPVPETEKKASISKGQAAQNVKKAGLLDLIEVDGDAVQESDAMTVDN